MISKLTILNLFDQYGGECSGSSEIDNMVYTFNNEEVLLEFDASDEDDPEVSWVKIEIEGSVDLIYNDEELIQLFEDCVYEVNQCFPIFVMGKHTTW